MIHISDEKRREEEFPGNINPYANPSATMAVERARLAMDLAGRGGPAAAELRDVLLDRDEPGDGGGFDPDAAGDELDRIDLEPEWELNNPKK